MITSTQTWIFFILSRTNAKGERETIELSDTFNPIPKTELNIAIAENLCQWAERALWTMGLLDMAAGDYVAFDYRVYPKRID